MNRVIKNVVLAVSSMAIGLADLPAQEVPAPPVPPTPAGATAAQRVAAAPAAAAVSGAAAAPGVVAATNSGARIQFSTITPDLGKVKTSEPAKYTFIFTNVGTETLEVSSVVPHCGCTMAGEWTKKVEAGKTGTIPVQVNVAPTWPVGPFAKTVTINCNDTSQPPVTLTIKGTIWKPIDVVPQFAMLNIPPDSPIGASTVVRIINNTEELITLSPPECNNHSFGLELKTNQPGKEFQLTITALPPFTPGSVQGQITIKTSSTNMPVVTLTALANSQPAVSVMPPQIMLPPAPLSVKSSPTVMIQYNGAATNTLTLTDPAVSAKDVEVQIKEMQPGRSYNATLNFPPGFEIPPGQQVVFTVKSSHPQFPVIKVPVSQMARTPAPPLPIKPGTPSPSAKLAVPPSTGANH